MSLFSCSGCYEGIPSHKARVKCQNCPTELCANCFVVQKFSQNPPLLRNGHAATHVTLLFNPSGYAAAAPPQNQQHLNPAPVGYAPSPAFQTTPSPVPYAAAVTPQAQQNLSTLPAGYAASPTPQPPIPPPSQTPVNRQSVYLPAQTPPAQNAASPQVQQSPPPGYYQNQAQQYAAAPAVSELSVVKQSPPVSQPPPAHAVQVASPAAGAPAVSPPQPQSAGYQPYAAAPNQHLVGSQSVASPSQPQNVAYQAVPAQSPPQAGYQAFTSPQAPHPPQTSQAPLVTQAPQSPQAAFVWQPLFVGTAPTPTFIALMDAFFTHLDPQQTGLLSPDVYSSFLDTQGYELQHNVWKKTLTPTFGQNAKDMADFELKQSYDNFSIEYILRPRNEPPNTDMAQMTSSFSQLMGSSMQAIINASAPSSISGGQMPMLTRKGFVDITAVEVLYDPSKEIGNLNRALQAYGLWRDRGLIPRNMLPEYPPPEILERVRMISIVAQNKAQQMLAAKQAELRLKQQGQQNALDLLDDRRYYYR